jgi:Ubiquitin-protein ligase
MQGSLNIYLKLKYVFRGPEGTCFEGGVFPAKVTFPSDYPLSPPKMQFTCEMFHPNSKYTRRFYLDTPIQNDFHQYLY